MLFERKDTKLLNAIEKIDNLSSAKEVIKELAQNITMLELQLEDILINLTSDNVSEIDFGLTRAKNYKKTILKNYVTQDELRLALRALNNS